LEKVSDAVPTYDMKTILGTSKINLEKSRIYIQHVEGTAFTTEQITKEI
jgi:hypothetical protein